MNVQGPAGRGKGESDSDALRGKEVGGVLSAKRERPPYVPAQRQVRIACLWREKRNQEGFVPSADGRQLPRERSSSSRRPIGLASAKVGSPLPGKGTVSRPGRG